MHFLFWASVQTKMPFPVAKIHHPLQTTAKKKTVDPTTNPTASEIWGQVLWGCSLASYESSGLVMWKTMCGLTVEFCEKNKTLDSSVMKLCIYIYIYRRKFSLHELLEDIVVLQQPHVWKNATTVRVNGLLGMPHWCLSTPSFQCKLCTTKHVFKKKVYNGYGSSCHSIDIFPVQFGGKMETYQPVFNWAKSYRIASSQNFPYRCDLGIGTQIVQEAKSPSLWCSKNISLINRPNKTSMESSGASIKDDLGKNHQDHQGELDWKTKAYIIQQHDIHHVHSVLPTQKDDFAGAKASHRPGALT